MYVCGDRGVMDQALAAVESSQWRVVENTVDKAVWGQPGGGLRFQDKGSGLDPGGSGSQRRLGKGVDLMKEFLIH